MVDLTALSINQGRRPSTRASYSAAALAASLAPHGPKQGSNIRRGTTMNVEEMKRGARPAVAALLEKMDEDGSGEVEQDEMLNFFADHIHAQHAHNQTRAALFGVLFLLLVSVLANAMAMFTVGDLLKENHTRGDGAMTDLSGNAVMVAPVASFASLFDLPRQSIDYMKNMKDIVVVVSDNNGGGVTTKYTINSWEHHSSSHMVLAVTDTATIVLKDGTGYVQEGSVHRPILVDASPPAGRRHLATHLRRLNKNAHMGAVHTFSWEQLKDLHRSVRGEEHYRRLSEAGDAVSDLYMFFGGVIESTVLPDTAELDAVDCDATGTCAVSVAEPPRPEIPALSKWDTVDLVLGDAMTWYMDLKDSENPQVHIVTNDESGTLTHEVWTGKMHYRYYGVVDVGELGADLGKVKDQCNAEYADNEEAATANAEGAFVLANHADGSATWQVGQWEVTVAADGLVTNISNMVVNSIVEYVDDGSEAAGTFQLYETCDPMFDYDAEFAATMDDNEERRLTEGRNLGGCYWWGAAKAYFQSGAEYGNFCGKGFPYQCRDNGKPQVPITGSHPALGTLVCDDGGADRSCAKHDSGAEFQDLWGVATMNYCEVDRTFKNERNSGVVNGFHDGVDYDTNFLDGANCLFGVMPCFRYENHNYWSWCGGWWKYPCRKSTYGKNTKWPWGNYQSGGCNQGNWGGCWNTGGPDGHQ